MLKSVCLKLFLETLELASTMYESEFYPVVVFWNGVLNFRKLFLSLLLVLRAIPKTFTAWKVSKYKVFSGPYFPSFGLNVGRCSVSLCIQSECEKKYRPEKTPYLDTFHAVIQIVRTRAIATVNWRSVLHSSSKDKMHHNKCITRNVVFMWIKEVPKTHFDSKFH